MMQSLSVLLKSVWVRVRSRLGLGVSLAIFVLLLILVPPVAERFLSYSTSDSLVALTGLVVLWYTLETREMRKEMTAARVKAETPEVGLRIDQLASGFFNLVLENTSPVPAFKLRFTESPDLPLADRVRTSDIGFLKDGVAYLAPGQSYRAFFLNFPELVRNSLDRSALRFRYTYENRFGEEIRRDAEVNLLLFWGSRNFEGDFNARILQGLDQLRDAAYP